MGLDYVLSSENCQKYCKCLFESIRLPSGIADASMGLSSVPQPFETFLRRCGEIGELWLMVTVTMEILITFTMTAYLVSLPWMYKTEPVSVWSVLCHHFLLMLGLFFVSLIYSSCGIIIRSGTFRVTGRPGRITRAATAISSAGIGYYGMISTMELSLCMYNISLEGRHKISVDGNLRFVAHAFGLGPCLCALCAILPNVLRFRPRAIYQACLAMCLSNFAFAIYIYIHALAVRWWEILVANRAFVPPELMQPWSFSQQLFTALVGASTGLSWLIGTGLPWSYVVDVHDVEDFLTVSLGLDDWGSS